MKLVYPEISRVFDTEIDKVPTLVIEHQGLLYRLLSDIRVQIEGNDGKCAVSSGGKLLPFDKNVELLTEFVPFCLNKKVLLNRAAAVLEQSVMQGELYGEAAQLSQMLESFLLKASLLIGGDVYFSKLAFSNILKSSGLEFREDYDSLAEKLLDYMELVTEYERKKLFVFYNLRSLISDGDTELFLDSVLRHEYNIIMIESSEHPRLSTEQRYIVDGSLCEIC